MRVEIGIELRGDRWFRVIAARPQPLTWDVSLTETVALRLMNEAARRVPESWGPKRFMLRVPGSAAGWLLGTGKMNLTGRTPNGQEFITTSQTGVAD